MRSVAFEGLRGSPAGGQHRWRHSEPPKTDDVSARLRAGALAGRLCGAEERRSFGQRAKRATVGHSCGRLFERDERSE